MANNFGKNPNVLDTAASDSSYTATNDAYSPSGTGTLQYTTQKVKIKKIQIIGAANTDDVLLRECSSTTLKGDIIIKRKLETGDLNPSIDFGEGIWFDGLYLETKDGNTELLIHLA